MADNKPLTFKPLGPCNVDMTGERYGFLTVLGYAGFDRRPSRCAAMWYCKCENCGRIKKVARTGLRYGRAKSCGKKGCKAQATKQFPPHPASQRYNLKTAERKRKVREARKAAAMLAKVQFAARMKAEANAVVQQPDPLPAPALPLPKLRRAIDTPEWFQKPALGKRGPNGRLAYSHSGGVEQAMPSPFVEPDTALWMQVRA